MNKIIILFSILACFSLQADICLNGWLNGWLNKYRYGENYKYFTKSKISFLGFSWEKATLEFNRNQEKDRQDVNIYDYYEQHKIVLEDNIKQVPQFYDNHLRDNAGLSNLPSSNYLSQKYADFCTKLQDHVYKIKPITVASKNESIDRIKHAKVARQEGNTCGFHALKNAIGLLNNNTQEIAAEFNHLQEWKETINKDRDLDQEDIKTLADYSGMDSSTYTIIPNIAEFQPYAFCGSDKQFETLCKAIGALQEKNPAKHAFILGNMQHIGDQGAQNTSYGHWVTILATVNEQGEQELHCADSFYEKVNDAVINSFKKLLNQDPNELRMKNDLECFLTDLETKSIETQIRDCKRLLEIAREKDYVKHKKFAPYIKNIQSILNNIASNTLLYSQDDVFGNINDIINDINDINEMIESLTKDDDTNL